MSRTPPAGGRGSALLAVLLPCLLWACLLGRPPEPPRYFRPVVPDRETAARPGPETPRPTLRLRRVSSASHLGERVVWRASQTEVGFYDTRRWTEPPARFVDRVLSRELFEVRGLRRASAGRVPALDVDLLAFEEVLAPEHRARIEVHVLLLDGRNLSLLETTHALAEPVADHESLSLAMGRALDGIVRRVADEVEAALIDAGR